jgi:hypothetical protein
MEKLLPKPGNQSHLNSRRSVLFKIVNPSNETTNVIIEESKAHDFAEFSFLRKNAATPVNNGTNIRSNEIILNLPKPPLGGLGVYFLIKN